MNGLFISSFPMRQGCLHANLTCVSSHDEALQGKNKKEEIDAYTDKKL
jgi:hypothetical protein